MIEKFKQIKGEVINLERFFKCRYGLCKECKKNIKRSLKNIHKFSKELRKIKNI